MWTDNEIKDLFYEDKTRYGFELIRFYVEEPNYNWGSSIMIESECDVLNDFVKEMQYHHYETIDTLFTGIKEAYTEPLRLSHIWLSYTYKRARWFPWWSGRVVELKSSDNKPITITMSDGLDRTYNYLVSLERLLDLKDTKFLRHIKQYYYGGRAFRGRLF